ncbi:MAG TPA: hypothetical protein VGT24_01605 [Candidatus Acidoferrales bacterium]|nr:hypothetical protein [Candidatus Acidoferrales bacterium]
MDSRTYAGNRQEGRKVKKPRQAVGGARERQEAGADERLPINRSHFGSPGVSRMRKAGWSEERIKQAVRDWLLKPIPRTNRLNGYRRELGLSSLGNHPDRLICHLTPEQMQKAHSIFRTICERHARDLELHPKRRGVYWACAVSRVRATGSYANQRELRNMVKRTYNRIIMPPPQVEHPAKVLERANYQGNRALHRMMDIYEAQNG